MIKILIISANEIRHQYFRKKISQFKNIEIGLCVVEKNSTRQFYDVMYVIFILFFHKIYELLSLL